MSALGQSSRKINVKLMVSIFDPSLKRGWVSSAIHKRQRPVDHVEHICLMLTSSMNANGYSSINSWELVKTMV